MGRTVDHIRRAPLNGRGPSKDQPAPGSRRHIPVGSPEPPPTVTVVAVLEQDPGFERWERVGDGLWRHAGYRGRMSAAASASGDTRIVPWSSVGVCSHGGKHDLKDVTGRTAQFADRPADRLPEQLFEVLLDVASGETTPDGLVRLQTWCRDADITAGARGGGKVRVRFNRAASTALDALTSAARDAEVAGLTVVSVGGAQELSKR